MNCKGCKVEMEEAYKWQQLGYCIDFRFEDKHKAFIVFKENGEIIIE